MTLIGKAKTLPQRTPKNTEENKISPRRRGEQPKSGDRKFQPLYHRGHPFDSQGSLRAGFGTQRRSNPGPSSLVRHGPGAASAFGRFFHDQDEWQADGKHNRKKSEDVSVGDHGGLLLHHPEESGSGLFGGGDGVHAAGHERTFHLGHHVLGNRI